MHCISKPDGSVEYGKHVNHFEQAAKKLKNQEGMAVDEASNNSEPKTELSDGESSEDVQEDSPLIESISIFWAWLHLSCSVSQTNCQVAQGMVLKIVQQAQGFQQPAPISKLVFGDIRTSKKGWKRKVGTMRAEQ
ncbi:hypothetical protein CROQUDRAFT_651640 [Cronartium quercuum f. sp. fusiforme G11]|uniref:Uncharacterized protein n=1 Tax=Cronartium quercuum f. sp. fusiforme G11 TaxID=708437 RepID=A0A9P6NPU5_9BASI|nr:hypothetical protein CROQUDRAFT_651640 [Cronartium quercuum f. sp. fusiforme G11]